MPGLHTAALAALESSINGALRYDPGTCVALGRLHGKILEIDSSAPTFRFFIAPDAQGVQLMGHFEGEVTTRLRGPLPALISLAASDNTSLAGSGVDMFGSSALLGDLQRILKRVDIDWEEPISRLVGDVAGHEAGTAIRKSLHWLSARTDTANRLLGEYLTEELRSLPAPAEVQSFCGDVDEARLSADRLTAKIDQLKQLVEQLRAPSAAPPPARSEPHNN